MSMTWVKDRIDTAIVVFWPQWRKVKQLAIGFVSIGAFTWITGFLGSLGFQLTEEPVWPWWARLIAGILAVATYLVIDYATILRLQLVPQIEVGLAPVKNMVLKRRLEAGGYIESNKRVVHGKVKGISQSKMECEAHLTAVRYQGADGEPFQAVTEFASLALLWSRTNEASEMVPKGVTSYFRIVQADSDDHRLYVPSPQEIALFRELFVRPGKYEIDIVVTAGSISKEMTIEATYTGDWGDLSAIEKKIA